MKKINYMIIVALCFVATTTFGQAWQPMPGGLLDGPVISISSFGGYVWVGGNFSNAGPVVARNVVRHDGSQWVSVPSLPSPPFAFSSYNGNLFAFGAFDTLGVRYGCMKWTGSSWLPMARVGSSDKITTAIVYGGELIVGGHFYSIDATSATSLAKWNGMSWSAFAGTTNCGWSFPPHINSLDVSNGSLYVAGAFDELCGTYTNCAAKWNGSVWSPLTVVGNTYASAIAHTATEVFIGGNFQNAGAATSSCVAREGASGWVNAGNGVRTVVMAMATYQNKIYVGGSASGFSGDNIGNCGYWNGIKWMSDNQGIHSGYVITLFGDTVNDRLYAGGNFDIEHGDTASYIAFKGNVTLPVDLTSFSCHFADNAVTVAWSTASEINADYFLLAVSLDAVAYENIATINAHGTTTFENEYVFNYPATKSGIYYFRLMQFDWDGTCAGVWFDVIRVKLKSIIIFDQQEKIIFCTDCDIGKKEISIYASSGILVEKKYLPVTMEGYAPGMYVARSEEFFLRFFLP